LATREALSMALNEFEGTVMLVSHDRALLRAVCDEFWMVSHGGVAPFDGDLDDYQKYLLDHAKRQREEAKKSGSSAAAAAAVAIKKEANSAHSTGATATFDAKKPANKKDEAQRRQQQLDATKPLRKELEKIDQQMQALNTERNNLQSLLTSTSAPAEMAQTGKRLKAIENEIGALEERWLELTEQIETAAV
jgi:ATP-binding cassette subfamily F protein 3